MNKKLKSFLKGFTFTFSMFDSILEVPSKCNQNYFEKAKKELKTAYFDMKV